MKYQCFLSSALLNISVCAGLATLLNHHVKSKVARLGKRPNPTILKILEMDDKVMHNFWDCCKESIIESVKTKKIMEDDHASALLWMSLCARFHKLKELEERTNLLQAHEERISQLKEELRFDDEDALAISFSFHSCNFPILSEQQIQGVTVQPHEDLIYDQDNIEGLVSLNDKDSLKSFSSQEVESFNFEIIENQLIPASFKEESFQINTQPEYAAFNFIEEDGKNDSLQDFNESILESFHFEDAMILLEDLSSEACVRNKI